MEQDLAFEIRNKKSIRGLNPYKRFTEAFEQQIDLCDRFLNNFAVESGRYTKSTSYFYKHVVEAYFETYIQNEAFIESAFKKFEGKKIAGTPNYVFKFRLRS